MARLSVGVLGLCHDHVWGESRGGRRRASSAGSWPRPIRIRALRERLGAHARRRRARWPATTRCSTAPTSTPSCLRRQPRSSELGVRALERGLPVMVEKPMAADLAGAEALLAASRAAGQPLMVNWPTAWRPALRHGLTLVRRRRGGPAGPAQPSRRPCRARGSSAARPSSATGSTTPRATAAARWSTTADTAPFCARDPRAAGRRHGRGRRTSARRTSRRGQRHRHSPVSARPGRPRGELDADRRRARIRHDPSTATRAPCSSTSRG